MKRLISFVLVATFILGLTACGASSTENSASAGSQNAPAAPSANAGKQEVMMIGTTISDTTPHGIALLEFEKLVEERSNGRIDVQPYLNSTMGDARQLAESIQLHSLQGCINDGASTSNFDKNFYATDLPFLFLSSEASYDALDGALGDALRASAEKNGMRILGFWDGGFRDVSNSIKTVTKPEDLVGLKVRVMEAPLYLSVWKAWGANPTPMAFSEVYTALQQGTVDGQDNGPVLTYNNKFFEVVKHYTVMEYSVTTSPFMVDISWFDALAPDLQEIIIQTERECRELERQLQQAQATEALEKMKAEGVEVTYLTTEQKQAFQEIAVTAWDVVQGDLDPEIYDLCLELAGKK